MGEALLEVHDLKTHFFKDGMAIPAVDGVTFAIDRGETLGIVGESGCGKSVTSLSVMRLIPNPPGRIVSGKILFEQDDLLQVDEETMRHIRGNKISMIFQEPMTSLNPVFTIGDQIMEAITLHQKTKRGEARDRAIEALRSVGIPAAEKRFWEYPHQMSGGMRQRVMIAMAIASRPRLLLADEPTTALDVTIQAQVLDIMKRLQTELEMALILITHDLGVVAEMADRVVVMYAGQIVESAIVAEIFQKPLHPYTLGLLRSIPAMNEDRRRLHVIDGFVPSPSKMPVGCRFHPRCPSAEGICRERMPRLIRVEDDHAVRCWRFHDNSRAEEG